MQPIDKIIRDAISALQSERDTLDGQIASLESALMALGGAKRRPGRPKGSRNAPTAAPAADVAPPAEPAKARKKPKWSAAAKKAAAERMRARWAERKRGTDAPATPAPTKRKKVTAKKKVAAKKATTTKKKAASKPTPTAKKKVATKRRVTKSELKALKTTKKTPAA